MFRIITTNQVQNDIGSIVEDISKYAYIVKNQGEKKIVMLPYFDGCDEFIEEYLEDCEMYWNKEVLQRRFTESLKSGKSDLAI